MDDSRNSFNTYPKEYLKRFSLRSWTRIKKVQNEMISTCAELIKFLKKTPEPDYCPGGPGKPDKTAALISPSHSKEHRKFEPSNEINLSCWADL